MTSDASSLKTLVDAHALLAGPFLGWVGWALLRWQKIDPGRQALFWMALAKSLSTALWVFPLGLLFQAWVPHHLGPDPMARLPWALMAFGLAGLAGSALLEMAFVRRSGVGLTWKASAGLSFRANAVCLVLLVAFYLPFSRLSLLGAPKNPAGSRRDEAVRVFYLRDGALFERGLGGPETRRMDLDYSEDARVFARRGAEGWDLWIQERDRSPRLVRAGVAPAEALAPAQPVLHIRLKEGVRLAEPAWPETYGRPAEAIPAEDTAWSVRLGQWPGDGLRVESRGLQNDYDLALDTPLLAWAPRCATRLPGERLLFQMGPYLWLLELETRRLVCLGMGQGAQVFWGVDKAG